MEKASPTAVKVLTDLFKRPWWTRVWVVQELSLAKQDVAIVHIGHLTSPWLSWLMTTYAIESSWFIVVYLAINVSEDPRTEGFLNGIRMSQCRKVNPMFPWYTIVELPNQHRDCEVTKLREKVNGLLGLVGDTVSIGIKPIYTLKAAAVFVDLVSWYVDTTSSLDIICGCQYYPWTFEDLPSWVSDWSTDQTTPGICIHDRYVGGNIFPGSPVTHHPQYAASGEKPPQIAFGGNILTLKQVPVGTIVGLGDVDDGIQFDDVGSFGTTDESGKSGSDSEIFNN